MIQFPKLDLYSVWLSLTALMSDLHKSPRFRLYDLAVIAVPSESTTTTVSDESFASIKGAIQIAGTTSDTPVINVIDAKKLRITYSFDADTVGKQNYKLLLVGL